MVSLSFNIHSFILVSSNNSTCFRKMPEREISTTILNEPRVVVRKFLARPQHEGMGAIVRRSIGRYIYVTVTEKR